MGKTAVKKERMTFKEAVNRALIDEMTADDRVFVFGLDVSDHKRIFGSTKKLVEKFGPKRCFVTPLSEDGMAGVALGAALSGLRPVQVHIRVDFMLLSMNQIANMISCARYVTGGKSKVPLVIRAVIGRGWGQGPQHSKTMQSAFAHIPGLKVVMPTNPQDVYSLTRSAIQDDNPVIMLEHRWLYDAYGDVDFNFKIPLGKSLAKREGSDVSVVTTSWMMVEALKAREVLEKRNVSLEIVDVRSLAPLDSDTIVKSVKKTKRCIVADYDWTFCGFGAELAAQVSKACFGELKHPVERIGFAHTPCPTTRPLENVFYPSASETDLSGESFYSWENRFKGPF
jgi:acetoin:2,6-dichlorophenolindophenol oxidoreductase subunit beta